MRYEFLPPYSPDYNPIELMFSAVKSYIRRNGGIIREAMGETNSLSVLLRLNEAVHSISVEDADGWYRHCGY